MMTPEFVANLGTKTKLETVFDYAEFYTEALKNQPKADRPFSLKYLDVFAGTGEINAGRNLPLLDGVQDYDKTILGSARRALSVQRPFSAYVFADIKQTHVGSLKNLENEFPHLADRISVHDGDANETISLFCNNLKGNERALVFIDPFGLSVEWSSLEKIAETKKIDLWYYFPCFSVFRQIDNQGQPISSSVDRLDKFFGTQDWKDAFVNTIASNQPDMFQSEQDKNTKIVTTDLATEFMIKRMNTIFEGGVNKNYLRLGKNKMHMFSLIFACSNPRPQAFGLAHKVANSLFVRK
jgi:three-Cys-motif partner protein